MHLQWEEEKEMDEFHSQFDPLLEEEKMFDYLNCDNYMDYAISLVRIRALQETQGKELKNGL